MDCCLKHPHNELLSTFYSKFPGMSISVSEGLDIPASEGLESSTTGSCRSNKPHVRRNSNASYRKLC